MDPALALEIELITRHRAVRQLIERGDSNMQQFFKDSVIFMTGGSGFIGKQLMEKLLRSCKIKKVYLLLRTKKQKTLQQRLDVITAEPVFNILRETQPDFGDKIEAVCGDVSELILGLNDEDWTKLTAEVNFIIHLAATVNFMEPIQVATLTNVRGTREMLTFGKACKMLRSYVHISTAYSHATYSRIGQPVLEQFYPSPVPPSTLIEFAESVDKNVLDNITPLLTQQWPNTYTFTKAVAEEAVRTMAGDLPICIVRPAIGVLLKASAQDTMDVFFPVNLRNRLFIEPTFFAVTSMIFEIISAQQEPTPGWIDKTNALGPSGVILGAALGALHVVNAAPKSYIDFVPVDYVNNAIISAAHETAVRRQRGETETKIYTVASSRNSMDMKTLSCCLKSVADSLASNKALWYNFGYIVKNRTLYYILFWFFHFIPAYLIDGVFLLLGKKQMAVKLYDKAFKMSDVFTYFLSNSFKFGDDNLMQMRANMSPTDRTIYQYDMATIDWKLFITTWCIGVRKYILRDDLKNTAYGLKKQKVLRIVHYLFTSFYVYALWKICCLIFCAISYVYSLLF